MPSHGAKIIVMPMLFLMHYIDVELEAFNIFFMFLPAYRKINWPSTLGMHSTDLSIQLTSFKDWYSKAESLNVGHKAFAR